MGHEVKLVTKSETQNKRQNIPAPTKFTLQAYI